MDEIKKEGALKKQLIKIANAGRDSWFGFVLINALAGLVVIVGIAISSDHKVRCYYLQTTYTQAGLAYQIMSDMDWKDDGTAFSSSDEDKTLEVILTLKQCAPAN